MPELTSFILLVLMAELASVVVAEEQIAFRTDSAAVQVTPHQQSTPSRQEDVSFKIPYPLEISIKNTTSTLPQDLDAPKSSIEPSFPWLITSPYEAQEHLTNLSTLPLPSRLLTLALTHLTPTSTSYATTPYHEALNWPTIFEQLKSISAVHNHTWTTTTFYVVEFRSRLKTNIDRKLLFDLDRESHREATGSGGLLKYWFGSTSDNVEGRNLATCK